MKKDKKIIPLSEEDKNRIDKFTPEDLNIILEGSPSGISGLTEEELDEEMTKIEAMRQQIKRYIEEVEEKPRQIPKTKALEPVVELVSGRWRQGAELIKQRLLPQDRQLTIFDQLEAKDIQISDYKTIGLKTLSVQERYCLDSLVYLLNKVDPKAALGNTTGQTPAGELKAGLVLTLQDYYRAFSGKDRPTGKEIKDARAAIKTLAEKKFILSYEKKTSTKKIKITPVTPEPLLSAQYITVEDYSNKIGKLATVEGTILPAPEEAKKELLAIHFHPIINLLDRYTSLPDDWIQRQKVAAKKAGSKVTPAFMSLALYLARQINMTKKKADISIFSVGYNKLLEVAELAEIKSKPSVIKSRLIKALQGCKHLGLIVGYKIETYPTGKRPDGEKYKVSLSLRLDWLNNLPKID